LADDPILDYIHTITLSYTFYPANRPAGQPVAEARVGG
jgi:cytochrome c oxidase assembly protein Cox11